MKPRSEWLSAALPNIVLYLSLASKKVNSATIACDSELTQLLKPVIRLSVFQALIGRMGIELLVLQVLLKLGDSLGPLAGHVVEVICEDAASVFLSI